MFGHNKQPKPVMQKKIPTILGLIILIAALVAGLIFFGDGTGVFAPRATPETTPKNVKVTNLKDTSFTVSFYTEESTSGFVKYGTDAGKLNSQISDDRDQLSGTIEDYKLHHITVRGLEPNTEYFYVLGTGSKAEFDNEGQPFSITTSQVSQSAPDAETIYGSVANQSGTPAEGSVIYVSAAGMTPMSSLVKSSGSWAIPISQARTKQGDSYAQLKPSDAISLLVQGIPISKQLTHQTTIEEAQPVPELVLGSDTDATAGKTATPSATATPVQDEEASQTAQIDQDQDSSVSGTLQDLLDSAEPLPKDSTASSELSLASDDEATSSAEPKYTTQQPKIKGKAKPNVEVKIEVHSDNQYESTVTADESGEFELDLEALKATLEPGEHTVTYSYIDPDSGEEVIKTETFYVEDPDAVKVADAVDNNSQQTASDDLYGDTTTSDDGYSEDASSTEDIPYGSGSPVPISTPTPTPSIVAGSSSTAGARKGSVATDSSMQAGSIEATLLLVIGGLFFLMMGGWSWWLASELDEPSIT